MGVMPYYHAYPLFNKPIRHFLLVSIVAEGILRSPMYYTYNHLCALRIKFINRITHKRGLPSPVPYIYTHKAYLCAVFLVQISFVCISTVYKPFNPEIVKRGSGSLKTMFIIIHTVVVAKGYSFYTRKWEYLRICAGGSKIICLIKLTAL